MELFDEAAWDALAAQLPRLLSVSVDERQWETNANIPTPWLVVQLHLIKGGGDAKIAAVLDAVARLYSTVELLNRRSVGGKIALWTRVLASPMMVLPLRADDPTIWRFTRHVGHGAAIRVLLDWTGTHIDKVLPCLQQFLKTGIQSSESTPRMRMGLRLARCRVTTESIAALDEILTNATALLADPARLVSSKLERLDLSDNGLTPESLEALALLLQHHDIREICLKNALFRAADPRSVTAMQAVLKSAFSGSEQSTSLDLSLAMNSLDARYYEVLAGALEAATRPLRRLSLAHTKTMSTINDHDREDCWQWIALMCFSKTRVASSDQSEECELDLSGNALYDLDMASFQVGLARLLLDDLDVIRQARLARMPLWCRASRTGRSFYAPHRRSQMTLPLAADRVYDIQDVREDGWVLVANAVEIESSRTQRWIPVEFLTQLGIDDRSLLRLRQRFNSLLLDDPRTTPSTMDAAGDAMPLLMTSLGPGLKKLSLRLCGPINEHDEAILRGCPHLTHLDIRGNRLLSGGRLWPLLQNGALRDLESLNVGGNPVGVAGVNEFAHVVESAPGIRLRHVVLSQASLGLRGLTRVAQLLEMNATLEVVELDRAIDFEIAAYADTRTQMAEQHDGRLLRAIPLSFESKIAFLWAIARLHERYDALGTMDAPIVALVMEFAGERVTRHLLWS